MITASPLPSPSLPQMSDDGYINEVELLSSGGVAVMVNRYSNAAVGDYLSLFWDGEAVSTLWLTENNIDTAFPWQVIVPEELVPDGSHSVWYTSTDTYQNIAASSTTTAIVDRSHTGSLPPPVFIDAVAGVITYSSVMLNSGTHVEVPGDALAVGDTVTLYWVGFDESGVTVPASVTSVTHTVTSADLQRFDVLIAPSYITPIGEGSAQAWYSVTNASGIVQNSDSASVNIVMAPSVLYPAPIFPAGGDGWLDCAESSMGVDITVPASSSFVANSVITIYWQGYARDGSAVANTYDVIPHVVAAADVTDGFTVTVPPAYVTPIGVGYGQAWYQVNSPSIPGVSELAQVSVDTEHCSLLPAPEFPAAADDGVIDADEITADSGTEMTVSYPGMAAGDTVTAFWYGYVTSPSEPVAGTSWTETRTLVASEAEVQQAVFHIPAAYITPVGVGYCEGRYQVLFHDEEGIASSATTDVKIDTTPTAGLWMICGTGAPLFDPHLAVRPLNSVTLQGPAGADVQLSVSGTSGAYFNANDAQTLTVRLDETGFGFAQVYSYQTGNVPVSAYVISDPQMSARASMTFTRWLDGQGELQYYGISTGAAADGKSLCSVYLVTSEPCAATWAQLSLTNNNSAAITVSGDKTAFINVSGTHAGGFDITDGVAETVEFTLSLVSISGSYITSSLVFSAFNH